MKNRKKEISLETWQSIQDMKYTLENRLIKTYVIRLINSIDEIVKIIYVKNNPTEEKLIEILAENKDIAMHAEVNETYRLHTDILEILRLS